MRLRVVLQGILVVVILLFLTACLDRLLLLRELPPKNLLKKL
jgi:hypothetical protein